MRPVILKYSNNQEIDGRHVVTIIEVSLLTSGGHFIFLLLRLLRSVPEENTTGKYHKRGETD